MISMKKTKGEETPHGISLKPNRKIKDRNDLFRQSENFENLTIFL